MDSRGGTQICGYGTRSANRIPGHVLQTSQKRSGSTALRAVTPKALSAPCRPDSATLRGSYTTAQAVLLLRRGSRFEPRSCGICGEQSGTGASFLRVHRSPLPILIPPTAPHSSSIIRGCYNRPNSGPSTNWAQYDPTPRNNNNKKTTARSPFRRNLL
jgi:hypothetical protein